MNVIYQNSLESANFCKKTLLDKNDIVKVGNIICAYGSINKEFSQKFSSIQVDNGMYVVFKSGGGDLLSSVDVGNHLLNKDITVVVSEFCLSGCANYAFLAAKRKVVLQNSFVAWHGGAVDPALSTPDVIEIRIKEREAEDKFFQKVNINPKLIRDIPSGTDITKETKKNRLWSHAPKVLREKWKIPGIVYMWFPVPSESDPIPVATLTK